MKLHKFVLTLLIIGTMLGILSAIRYYVQHPCLKSHVEKRNVSGYFLIIGDGKNNNTHIWIPEHETNVEVCDERK